MPGFSLTFLVVKSFVAFFYHFLFLAKSHKLERISVYLWIKVKANIIVKLIIFFE